MPVKRTPWPSTGDMWRDGELLRVKEQHDKRMKGYDDEEKRRALKSLAERVGVPAAYRDSFVVHVVAEIQEVAALAASDSAVQMRELVEARPSPDDDL